MAGTVEINRPALLLSATETAASLGISRSLLYRLDAAGKLPQGVFVGSRRRWRAAELRDWARAGCPARCRWAWPNEEGQDDWRK